MPYKNKNWLIAGEDFYFFLHTDMLSKQLEKISKNVMN
jgi:hypothetical protein